MRKKTILLGFLAGLSGIMHARGQSIGPSTINAAGGSGSIAANKFDWSIGEMALVSTFTGSSVIVTQGVLQNNKHGTGVSGPSIADNLQVFPNPANNVVNIVYNAAVQGTFHYRLLDMLGKTITDRSVLIAQGVTQQQLNIADLAAATYLLEVDFTSKDASSQASSFKIDKLK